jgi:phosphatidylinositol glycan class U
MQIAESGQSVSSRLFTSPRKNLRWSSIAIGARYEQASIVRVTGLMNYSFLFSPFTIATCIARPTSALANFFVLSSIAKATQGASITSILALAFASYISFHPILLFPPLLLILYDVHASSSKGSPNMLAFAAAHTVGLTTAIGMLLYVSALLTGSWEFLAATYGVRLLLPDLTPNVGLWWYFFTEMFDSFREFFLGVFWLHIVSYVGGLTFRLRQQPLFVATSLLGIFAIFQPYPSIADSSLYFALVPLYRHIFPCESSPVLFDIHMLMMIK